MNSRLARALPFILVPLLGLLLLVPVACRQAVKEGQQYYCPMHPDYHSDKPGDCPICGMRLVKVAKKDGKEAEDARDISAEEARRTPGGIDGLAPVAAGQEGLRLAGVQTAVAERREVTRTTRAVGVVVPDETRIRHVQTKISGWVEKLYVNATGQAVRAGQPLLSLYSPELLATQEEFLRAREAAARFGQSSLPEVRRGGEDLLSAARRRLELFGVPQSAIAGLEGSGVAQRTVTLPAPVSGYVTAKEVFEGQQVQPGMDLFTVTDLSQVWVEADFYEYESAALRLGRQARVELPNDPGVRLTGRVAFVFPILDPQSRTLKVRLEFPNPGLVLKPGMYVDVSPDLEKREGIVVPDSAVIDTGVRQVVFVEKDGTFQPREVRVGSRGDGQALIVSGVAEGERVAVRANFLLDSELRLRAALAALPQRRPPDHQHGEEGVP